MDDTPDEVEVQAALAAATRAGEELASCAPASALSAGWARQELRLPPGLPLAGYGERHGAASTSKHEPLYARAIALRTESSGVILLAADLLLINWSLAAQVEALARREAPDLPTIFFTATHTHSGPGAWGGQWLEEEVAGDYDVRVRDSIAEDLAAAAVAAWTSLQRCDLGWVSVELPEGVTNRTVPAGPTDPTLEALILRRHSDRMLAVLAIYGAHATCLSGDTRALAGDYPTALVNKLESAGAIDFAAFAAGCVGSQAPQSTGHGQAKVDALSTLLAERLLPLVLRASLHKDVRLAALRSPIPLPTLQPRVGNSVRLSPWVASQLHPREAMFGALRIDERIWLGIPMEISGMLSIRLRAFAAKHGRTLTLTCFSGDYIGYVVPDEVYADGSRYESRLNFLGPRGGSFTTRLLERFLQVPDTTTYP